MELGRAGSTAALPRMQERHRLGSARTDACTSLLIGGAQLRGGSVA